MINLMIHTPVNTRARITEYVKELVPVLTTELDDEIVITSPHDFEQPGEVNDNWIDNCIADDSLPDMVLTHASEFSPLYGKDMKEFFAPLGGEYTKVKPVRKELEAFVDSESILYPLFVVPIVMCFNTAEIDLAELNHRWDDLLNTSFSAIVTERSKPITKIVGTHILKTFPEKFDHFNHLNSLNSPKEVIRALMTQEHNIGITNAAFAKIAENRGVSINPTKEGVMLLPQVVAFKKGADQRLLKVIDHLLEEDFQTYLGANGFFPVNPSAIMGETISLDGMIKKFRGWETYLKDILEYEMRIRDGKND